MHILRKVSKMIREDAKNHKHCCLWFFWEGLGLWAG